MPIRKVKWLFLGAILVILLVIAGGGLWLANIDLNNYKGFIAEKVFEKTGGKLVIEGPINHSLYPWLGLEIKGLSLTSAARYGSAKLLTANFIKFEVKLLPLLLEDRIEIKTLNLQDVAIDFILYQDGATNWQMKSSTTQDPLPASVQAIKTIAKIQANKQDTKIQLNVDADFDMSLAKLGLGELTEPINGNLLLSAAVDDKASIGKTFRIEPLSIQANFHGETFSSGSGTFKLLTDVEFKPQNGGVISFDSLNLDALGLKLKSQLKISDLEDDIRYQGELSMPALNLNQWAKQLGLTLPIHSAAINKTVFNGDKKGIEIQPLDLTIDESHITGNFNIPEFEDLKTRFDLSIDRFNLSRYLSGASNKTGLPPTATEKQTEPLPTEFLQTLDIDGKLNVGTFMLANLTFQSLAIDLKAKDGKIQIPSRAKFYGGEYTGETILWATPPNFKTEIDLTDFNTAEVLKALSNAQSLGGTGMIQLSLASPLGEATSIQKNLTGKIKAEVNQGTLFGLNVDSALKQAENMLKLKVFNKDEIKFEGETSFDELAMELEIKEGKAYSQNFQTKAPGFTIGGEGILFDLGDLSWDYNFTVDVKREGVLKDKQILISCQGPIMEKNCVPDITSLVGQFLGTKQVIDAVKNKLLDKVIPKSAQEKESTTEGLKEKATKKLLDKLF